MKRTGIFFIVESGPLENKTRLLIHTLRNFGGIADDQILYAYRPRRGPKLSKGTLTYFENNAIELVDEEVNQSFDFYPLANKPAVANHFESNYGYQYEQMLFLDSDLFICQPLQLSLNKESHQIAMRPWMEEYLLSLPDQGIRRALLEDCFPQLDPEAKEVAHQRAFNTGVILAKPELGIFSMWHEKLCQVLRDRRSLRLKGLNFYFLEESTLGYAAISQFGIDGIKMLDANDNAPVKPALQDAAGMKPAEVRILHYHTIEELYREMTKYPAIHGSINIWSKLIWPIINRPSWVRIREIIKFQVHKFRVTRQQNNIDVKQDF